MNAARRGHVIVLACGIGLAAALPSLLPLFAIINATGVVVLALLSLSLGLVWGFGGIMCFGQTAFFGLGGYAYAVAAINFGDSTPALPVAVLIPALFALALGYFMFYGRVADIYVSVITLTVTLILFKLANATAGPEYTIGAARLGGANGIPAAPPLNAPFRPAAPLGPDALFRTAMGTLLAAYLISAWLLESRFGRAAVAIRENPLRAELLGYDVRRRRLLMFAVGAAMAGAAGALFASASFVSPAMFGLSYAAQTLVWVVAGGLGTLVGPILGAVAIQYLMMQIGALGAIHPALSKLDSHAVLGAILIVVVLVLPQGLWPSLRRATAAWRRRTAGQ